MSQPSSHSSPTTLTSRQPSQTQFACSCREDGSGTAWVHMAGELDLLTSPQLRRMLRDAQLRAHMVVVDLRELVFMDCSGMHVLVDASAEARRAGARLILTRGRAHIDRLFAIARLDEEIERFDLDPSEAPTQALSRLNRPRAAA
jgi:anti-sigma B factor antagonist